MEIEHCNVESCSAPQEVHMFFYGKAIDVMIAVHGKDIGKVPIGDLLDSIEFFTREFHNGVESSYWNFCRPSNKN